MAYLVETGLLAWVVYQKLRLVLLRKSWFNFNLVWGAALVATGPFGAFVALVLAAATPTEAQVSPVSVPTYQYNNQRTAVNSRETILTRANVNTATFGKLFTQSVDGQIYAQPLYMPNVTINGAVHNVIFVATEHDSVYAFDADSNTGSNAQPLWKTSLIPSGETTVHATYCQDISPEYGITGTPVIDAATNTLYAVAETLQGPSNGNTYVKRLHALDITTGKEKPGSPVLISGANGISVTMPGQSPVTFDDLNDQYRGITIGSLWENQRAGLLFYNGVVYIAFGSHCDGGDNIPFQGVVGWRGWVLGYNGSSLNPVFVYSTEPSSVNGLHGGIWMSGQGLAMDSGSNLFFTTGNGNFDVSSHAYAQAVVRIDLSKGPTVQDYFSPYYSFVQADGGNSDLGSSGIAILPDQQGPFPHLAVIGDKFEDIFVVNRDNLGQFNASFDNVVQELDLAIGEFFSSPVYFNGKVYFWGTNDVLKAFTLTNGMLSTSATDSGPDSFSTPGSVPTISANGTSNAILWALRCDGDAECSTGALYAYDPNNLSAGSIYNSNQNPSDSPGEGVKFAVPIVANGKVYLGSSGQWSAYGLLGGPRNQAPALTSANNTTIAVGTAGNFTVTTTGSPTPTLTESGTLPSGVTFVDNGNGRATLSGTPAAGTANSYPLTITANNGVAPAATQNFTLTVSGGSGGGSSTFLYVPGSVTAAFSFSSNSSSPTLSVTLHQNPGVGHLLVCEANWQSSTAVASMSDNKGNTWIAIGGSPEAGVGGESGMSGQMFYVPSVSVSAQTTVTLTVGSKVTGRSLECAEFSYSGTNGTNASIDGTPQYSVNPASGGVAAISGLTTLNSGDLVIAACISVDSNCTTGSGYTQLNDTNAFNAANGTLGNSYAGFTGQFMQYKVGVAAGSQSATFGTGTSSDSVILGLVAMKAGPDPKAAPAITSANNTTFAVGTAGSFTVTTTGSPTPTLTESGTLPSGVTFVDNGNGKATLSGTPAAGTANSYPLTITANNGVAPAAAQNFTLAVSGGGGGGSSNFAYVNGSVTAAFNFSTKSSATLPVTLHQNPGAGHLLLCEANWQSSTATASMSDNNLNTWIAIGSPKAGVGGESGMMNQMFYVPSVSVSASTTVTLTISSKVTGRSLECAEFSYSGTNGTNASIDGTPQYSVNPASGGVATISGLTTLNSGDLVFAACISVDTNCTTGSGYTQLNDNNAFNVANSSFGNSYVGFTGQMIEYKVGVAAGAQTATFGTGTPSDSIVLGLVAMRAGPAPLAAPVITSSNNATFTVGTAGNFTVTTTGNPTPTLTESGTLPSAVTFVDNGNGTAKLSGTSGTAGSYPITITASNGVTPGATQNFTLTVNSSGGGGTATWGTMDAWVQLNNTTEGRTLTPTILQNGTVSGTLLTWQTCVGSGNCSNTTSSAFTAATSLGGLGGSITVNGTTYPSTTPSLSIALAAGNGFTAGRMAVPGGHLQVVANGYVVLGTSVTNNMDLITFYGTNGDWSVMQAQRGGGLAIETGAPTARSSTIPLTAGHRYSFSLIYDEVNGLGQLAVYDPSNGYAQVGLVTSVMPRGHALANVNVGNDEAGTASSTTYFEDLMLDWTNHTFPKFPH